jgi:4-hydroxybenzoate polyprenyltransferase
MGYGDRTPATPRTAARAVSVAARLRFRDILVLQGPPLMGLALGWNRTLLDRPWILPTFLIASVCLVAHVFALNDWAGVGADQLHAQKADRTFLAYGVSRAQMGVLAAGLGILSLGLFSLVSWWSALLAAAIAGLSLVYSHPLVGGKEDPGSSSVLHLAGGGLHFLLGYGVAHPIDGRGVLLAIYLGLVFAAGHLSQEVGDREGDHRAGLGTTAVRFGARRAFVASFLLFTVAVGLVADLGIAGTAPPLLALAAVALYPVQGLFFWRALRHGLTFDAIDGYRARYRLLYALIGLAVALSAAWPR